MAKIVGLVGAVSGKVGNFVGAVVGGVQTMRVYQPIVANPRTAGQVKQRAKVNLAGQLSSAITRVAIEGLGGNARQRRSALLKNLILSVNEASNVYSVKGESIVLSKGPAQLVASVNMATPLTGGPNVIGVDFNFTNVAGVAADSVDFVRLVALVVPKPIISGVAKPAIGVVDYRITSQAPEVSLDIPVVGETTNYNVFGYAIPMNMVNSSALTFDYLNSLQESGVIKLDGTVKTSGAFRFGDSVFLGVKSVTNA